MHPYSTGKGWDDRYSDTHLGSGAPGTVTHSDAANRLFYRAKFRALDRCIALVRSTIEGKSVLDAAGGSGQFVPYFLERKASTVTVADFSPVALELVAQKYRHDARVKTLLLDLAASGEGLSNRFDVVSVMEAIFLLPGDDDLARALATLSSCLSEGGCLIISDIFPGQSVRQNAYVVRRSKTQFEQILGACGLTVAGYVPQTFVFNRRLFGRFQRPLEQAGPLLYWLDRAAMSLGLRPPPESRADVKYLVAVRPGRADRQSSPPHAHGSPRL